VPVHSHGGLELTLVIDGSFSDATGSYGRGDLQGADETLQHQPHAGAEKDCICLAVTDGPLRFKSLAARLVQPRLGIRRSDSIAGKDTYSQQEIEPLRSRQARLRYQSAGN